jgi:hypothetical protein
MLNNSSQGFRTKVQLCPNSFAFMNPKLMREEQVFKGLLTH